MKISMLRFAVLFSLAQVSAPVFADDLVVIINPSAGINSLTSEDVMRIFLGKTKSLPNHKSVTAITQKEGTPLRVRFDEKVLNKGPHQIKAYWTQLIFTGRGTPPSEYASDADVKKLVAENHNFIGYISSNSLDASVRPVFTLK